MSTFNPIKRISAVALSLSLAFPGQLWAKSTGTTPAAADQVESAKDGVPFVYQEFDTPKGRAFAFITAVPEEIERDTILRLAAHDPKNMTLAVSGADDPGLKAALESGNAAWINTYQLGKLEDSKFAGSVKNESLKNRVIAKTKDMFGKAKSNPTGLIMAFGYAGIISTGAVYVQTSSVTATLGTIVPLTMLTAFVMTQSKDWGKYVKGGGNLFAGIFDGVASLFGKKIPEVQRDVYKATGMFLATMVTNGLSAGYVLHMSGAQINYPTLIMMAFATNIGVWDGTVERLVSSHKIEHKWEPRYFVFQTILSTIAELSVYLHMDGAESVLSMITITGLGYLIGGARIEQGWMKGQEALRVRYDAAQARIVATSDNVSLKTRLAAARAARAAARVGTSCNAIITGAADAVTTAPKSMLARARAKFSRQASTLSAGE